MTDVTERFGQWYTEPWTSGRILEMILRATLAGTVGMTASIAIVYVFGWDAIRSIGLIAPALYTLQWGFPDHYVDSESEQEGGR